MNKINLIGRLTAEPELKYTSTNIPNVKFTLAVNRKFVNDKGEREVDFIRCIAWRKTAEIISQYFMKGSQIGINGRLQTGSYDDKDGKKVFTSDVVIEEIDFIDKKQSSNEQSNEKAEVTPYNYQKQATTKDVEVDPFADFGNTASGFDDDFLE